MAPDAMAAPTAECQARDAIALHQAERLTALLGKLTPHNAFYTRKVERAGIRVRDLSFPRDLLLLPFTTKSELVADQSATPPWGTALTEPLDQYTRYNQTSSTTGRPLRWLDTTESWQWMLVCWKAVYRAARVTGADRILFPFSFGPFLGFWTAFDAGIQIGAHCIPTGGMSSQPRLALIETLKPTVICCTPTYALRLLDVSRALDGTASELFKSSVRVLIVAGEPGGSIHATRARIEQGWGGRIIDHYGLTEVGPIAFECWDAPGFLHVNEGEFIAEVVHPETGEPVPDGQQGELVVTNLGRTASPVIRYRTGDIVVRTMDPCPCGRSLARLVGGIVSRVDDMVTVRGVNVYPSCIESVIRNFDEVIEYRSTVASGSSMRTLSVEIELLPTVSDPDLVADGVATKLREALSLTVPVSTVDAGTLPRFEMKARRFILEKNGRKSRGEL